MKIREAKHKDIPKIIKVLKASLGEVSSEKTEKVWRYKHIDNPFGESLVLVAEEGDQIIGVRAFMRWEWQVSQKVYSAFRAVDTATHPDHQGKGIFKKLTLRALDIGNERGDHFVFNTPNSQSKPGYLKMGWKEVSKLRIGLVPVNPFYWKKKEEANSFKSDENIHVALDLNKWDEDLRRSGKIFTPKSENYLMWRYLKNPMQPYFVKSNPNYFIAGYVKNHGNFKEFRVSELIYNGKESKKEVKNVIKVWAKKVGVQFISLHLPECQKLFHSEIKGGFGPILTFKSIQEDIDVQNFLELKLWGYSLGDLELF